MLLAIDPGRCTGKAMMFETPTGFGGSDDYVVMIDGLTAGRIMRIEHAGNRPVWFWTITGPYRSSPASRAVVTATRWAAAKAAFRAAFDRWLTWALRQPGKASWHGVATAGDPTASEN